MQRNIVGYFYKIHHGMVMNVDLNGSCKDTADQRRKLLKKLQINNCLYRLMYFYKLVLDRLRLTWQSFLRIIIKSVARGFSLLNLTGLIATINRLLSRKKITKLLAEI